MLHYPVASKQPLGVEWTYEKEGEMRGTQKSKWTKREKKIIYCGIHSYGNGKKEGTGAFYFLFY